MSISYSTSSHFLPVVWETRRCNLQYATVLYFFSSTLKMGTSAPLSIVLLTTYLKIRLSQGCAPTFPDSSPYSNRSVSRLNTWQPPVLRPCINSHQPSPCFSQQCRNSLPISSDMHEQDLDLSDLDLAYIRPHSRSIADPSS